MIKKPVKIQLSEGLDARPIALLVQEASQYSSSVYIEVDQKQVNAKEHYGDDESDTDAGRRGNHRCCERNR